MFNDYDWSILSQPVVKIDDATFNAQLEAERKEYLCTENKKKKDILRFLSSNSSWPIEKIVEKLGLSWDVKKDLGNGIALIGFYTDSSMTVECFELHMSSDEVLAKF